MRALVVDDEPMARELIRTELGELEGIEIAGEAVDGLAAVEAIEALRPDVVFLDIEMAGLSGVELVRALPEPPLVVFVTAHQEFAVDAFELDAIDYLTKPVTTDRLEEAVRRVQRELQHRGTLAAPGPGESPPPQRMSDALLGPDAFIARFIVRARGRIRLLRVGEVNWARAAGNYVELHTDDQRHVVRMTLTELASRLDPSRFRRIHRSHVVSLDQIAEIRSDGHGAWEVDLHCGETLRMTATYRSDVLGTV